MAITDKIDIDPLDLISPERYGQNGPPHDVWTRLRIEDPVHWCEPEGFENFWAVTKHAHIMEVASQPEVFCNSEGIVVLNDERVDFGASQFQPPSGNCSPSSRSMMPRTSWPKYAPTAPTCPLMHGSSSPAKKGLPQPCQIT